MPSYWKSRSSKLSKAPACIVLSFVVLCCVGWADTSFVTSYRASEIPHSRCVMMEKKHKSRPRNSNKGPVFVDGPEMQKVKWSTAKSPSPNSSPDFGESKVPTTRAATRMAARAARRSKATRSKSPSGKGFVQTEAKTAKKKVAERKKAAPEAPQAEEAVQVVDAESEEERQFRERYLSAEKETEPEWKQQMDAAKTKEDRFRVGLQVGDFKTSYGILAEELIGSFADGDKERLDEFLTKAGVASWQLALIQLVVIGVPLAGITYGLGLWK
eukprot:Skav225037  [mRNA]  locus=scaffold2061:241550:243205:+ [translate_table: standard]